jgi:glycosyltransferase involved in cell wall biosynthesis
VLLDGWCRAFAEHDDVTLVLKVWSTHAARSAEDLGAEVAEALVRMGHDPARVPDVVILDRLLSRPEMSALYAACDVYLAPTRGEGWGRPATEAMAAGRPVIATGWSGPSAFCDQATGWTIPHRLVPVPDAAVREAAHFAGHRWAEPDPDGLAAALRDAHARPAERVARGRAARERALRFDHRRVAGEMLEVLGALTPRLADRPARRAPAPVAVAVEGAVFARHSLAAVNRDLARAMARTGRARVALVDLEGRAPADGEAAALGDLVGWSRALLDRRPDVTVRHSFPPVLDPPGAGPLVAIMPWEFGAAPVEWVAAQREGRVDEVWVPSEHTRQGYLRSGADPDRVVVVPNGVDPARFRPRGPDRAIDLDDDGRFRFLFVGGLVWRKGIDILLRAWEEAFRADDGVVLVVKDFGAGGPYDRNVAHEWIAALRRDPQAAPVVHNSDSLPEDAMPALYRSVDCLVQPYRGEGYCLPVAEAMACGLPVVIPEGGPTAEYAPPGTAITVATSPVVVPQLEVAGIVIPEPVTVAEVDAAALGAAMRAAYEDRDAARATGARAAAWMHGHHTWDHAAAVAVDRLERLAA